MSEHSALVSRRAALCAGAGALVAASSRAFAQQTKMLRLGFVGIQAPDASNYTALVKRMGELGYREGRNLTVDYVRAPSITGYEAAYRELAERKVDVLLAAGSEWALRAARAVAGMTPIVLLAIDFDPLDKGFVASLSRPGGNITGILVRQIELAAKRIQILREAMPAAHRLALMWDMASHEQADAAADAGRTLGFESRLIEVTGEVPDYTGALQPGHEPLSEPFVIPASPIFLRDRAAIARILLDRRIPAISAFRENAEAGALLSYGIDLVGLFADAGDYVDRIARGGNPAEMPIEQSTRFHMTINLKTADKLGITVPVAFTARANEVFE